MWPKMEYNAEIHERGYQAIVFDFDDTLSEHPGGLGPPGPPIEGMPELLRDLKADGFHIVIQTCRGAQYWKGLIPDEQADPQYQFNMVKEWCEKYDVPCDTMWSQDKPLAVMYVDDRGYHFDGDVDALRKEIHRRYH